MQITFLEQAVELADSISDEKTGFQARLELMRAAAFKGRSDLLLIHFAWCVAQCDRNPQEFSIDSILWMYKWVVENVLDFPEIPRSKVEEIIDDMERRYVQQGATLYSVYKLRRSTHLFFGEVDEAKRFHALFRKSRRDYLSDCEACVARANCQYYTALRQWARAYNAAEPVMNGQLTCSVEPRATLGRVLLAMFQLGKLEEAQAVSRRGHRLANKEDHLVLDQALYLRFATLTSDDAKCKSILEKNLPHAMKHVSSADRFQFLLAARLWLQSRAEKGTSHLKLRLPESIPMDLEKGKVAIDQFEGWLSSELQSIAVRFDTRAGTSAFQSQLDE